MIEFVTGDILKDDVEAIVVPVDCTGTFTPGIGERARHLFPANHRACQSAAREGRLFLARVFVLATGLHRNPRYIFNIALRLHAKSDFRLENVDRGLRHLVTQIHRLNIRSISIPPLGIGPKGLDWLAVREKIEFLTQPLDEIRILVHEPGAGPDDAQQPEVNGAPDLTTGRAALVYLMERYLGARMSRWITVTEIHKLMYLLQAAGEPLRLDFEKHYSGPYARNLKPVLRAIEGHFIQGYTDSRSGIRKSISPNLDVVDKSESVLKKSPKSWSRVKKLVSLIRGFQTPQGLELLAAVHWVTTVENASSPEEVVQHVIRWHPKKKAVFARYHIDVAVNILKRKGWL